MSQLLVVENGVARPVGGNEGPPTSNIGLKELSENYKILDSGDGYGVAVPIQFASTTDKKPKLDAQASASGSTAYGAGLRQDYNPEFVFPANMQLYRQMRTDAQVRSALRVAKSPVLAARWFMQPASQEAEDIERAEYIWRNINDWMSTSWPQTLMEVLYMLDYGFYVFEKVFTKGPDGLIRWKKLAPIHPMEVVKPIYDEADGGYAGITVNVERGGDVNEVDIPIEQLLIFTYDREAGDMMGTSALRSVYKHWFIKENLLKIDAIQKERHAIGIPIVILPLGHNDRDVVNAHQIGADLRGNESAHVVLPFGWEVKFAKLEGQNVDPIRSIEYHGRMIYENFLVNFMDKNPSTSHVGGSDETFMKGTRFIAEIIRDVVNKYAIPQLYDWNWDEPETGYPQLKVRRLGDTTDWRTMSFAHRNYVGAGMLTPDDKMEEWVREEMDLPMADPSSSREVGNPTRQKPTPPVGKPRGNAGTDRSGG